MTSVLTWLVGAKKTVVALLGSLLTVLTLTGKLPFLPPDMVTWVGWLNAVVTGLLTYLVPNTATEAKK